MSLPFIVPERREEKNPQPIPNLITLDDVRGLIHNHSSVVGRGLLHPRDG